MYTSSTATSSLPHSPLVGPFIVPRQRVEWIMNYSHMGMHALDPRLQAPKAIAVLFPTCRYPPLAVHISGGFHHSLLRFAEYSNSGLRASKGRAAVRRGHESGGTTYGVLGRALAGVAPPMGGVRAG